MDVFPFIIAEEISKDLQSVCFSNLTWYRTLIPFTHDIKLASGGQIYICINLQRNVNFDKLLKFLQLEKCYFVCCFLSHKVL